MGMIYGVQPGQVFWAARCVDLWFPFSFSDISTYLTTIYSDIGWVVGHSYVVYGPLLQGATTVLYEGKPVGTPDVWFPLHPRHTLACGTNKINWRSVGHTGES